MVKFQVCQMPIISDLGVVLTPSSHLDLPGLQCQLGKCSKLKAHNTFDQLESRQTRAPTTFRRHLRRRRNDSKRRLETKKLSTIKENLKQEPDLKKLTFHLTLAYSTYALFALKAFRIYANVCVNYAMFA
jgi:hypothetical protein